MTSGRITDEAELARRRAAFRREQQEVIDRHGWSVIAVFPTVESPGTPFSYTVGLTAHGFPEFMIFGLPAEAGHMLLNDMAGRVFDRAERFTHGQHVTDLISDYDAVVVDGRPPEGMPPGMAYGRYGPGKVAVQQVVWPDDAGRFPWDEGWSIPAGVQPVIGKPASEAA